MTSAPLLCVECGRASDYDARAWQAHLVDTDEGDEEEIVFFCPRCAEREFGELRRRRLDPPAM